jgi:putative phosphoribosyl transferase
MGDPVRQSRRRYADRRDAGKVLGAMMHDYRESGNVTVLGLPRGGVPVADEVADELDAPLDVLVVRKVGLPGQPELAMGAIAAVAGSIETVQNLDITRRWGDVPGRSFADVAAIEEEELRRRQRAYRHGRAALNLDGRLVILVDDGLATGATMRSAVSAVRNEHPDQVVVAVPVGLSGTCAELRKVADDVVCPWEADDLLSIGQAYVDFAQTGDAEVRTILSRASNRGRA